jgi:hypothetical protein
MNSAVIILFVAVFIIGIILLVIISVSKRGPKRLDTVKYQERWLHITNSIGDDPASMQLAVLNADKLLDTALRERGIVGSSMGERLKNNPKAFRDLNAVWSAHKLRNRIAHEHDMKITKQTVQVALRSFKAALTDLGAL